MSFEQEMRAMTAEDVRARVEARLRDGAGPAWNESQGEPVWSWLMSAFHYWREQPPQLQAVDQCLNTLLPALFAAGNWRGAEAGCDYVLALSGLQQPWQPAAARNWPFAHWLQVRPQKVADDQVSSMAAALRLMRALGQVRPAWALQNFRDVAAQRAGDGDSRRAGLYLLECWKAWAEASTGKSKALESETWFELLRHVCKGETEARHERIVTLAVDWALGRCIAAEASEFKKQLLLAIQHLSEPPAQASALKSIKEVLGELAAIQHAVQRSQAPPLRTRELRNTAGLERGSVTWLQAA